MSAPFYVYELVDPRDGLPFYVGKGTGDRVCQHEKDARRGEVGPRYERICEIVAAGHAVGRRIVRRFNDEERAYKFEARHIAAIGLERLTNIAPGGRTIAGDAEEVKDKSLARALVKIGAKTDGFRILRKWLFAETWHLLPACSLINFANQFNALERKRGRDWLVSAVS